MITILNGNALDKLKEIDDNSIQCVVTSPAYWGLRNYEDINQLGLEDSPNEYVNNLLKIFKQVKRVLKDDGVVWLNLGDCYASRRPMGTSDNKFIRYSKKEKEINHTANKKNKLVGKLKVKDLVGIPWRVAFALQDDGWYLRQDIIWQKTNISPESVLDRCTRSHEYIFMLTKKPKYYYNNEAIKENSTTPNEKRNRRDVWTISTSRFNGLHFATFPIEIPNICIKASTKEGDVVLDMFAGAGTTGLSADRLNRNAILIELNKDYAEIMYNRLKNDCPMFTQIRKDF